jgi:hypothetical protein
VKREVNGSLPLFFFGVKLGEFFIEIKQLAAMD